MNNVFDYSPAELCPNFPFTRVDLGTYHTDRAYACSNSNAQNTSFTPITVNINQIHPEADSVAYTLSSGELKFKFDGKVYLTVNVGYDNLSNARSDERFWLEKDTGSGWQVIPESEGFVYLRLASSDNTNSKKVLLDVQKGDMVRLRSQVDNGSANATKPNLCGFVINPYDKQPKFLFGLDAGEWIDEDSELDTPRCFDAGEIV